MLNFAHMNCILANFSHDLALARNCEFYTPPVNVRVMEHDLAGLSRYFGNGDLSYNPDAPVWGWNLSFAMQLRRVGNVDLPNDSELAEIRSLASRKTAVEVLKFLRETLPELPLCGESLFCRSKGELDACLAEEGRYVLKSPLSGSGRGLRFVKGRLSETQRKWALKCIKEQKGVVVEPFYNKTADFALEFVVEEKEVTYKGLSVFETNSNNVYAGNLLRPQNILWKILLKYFESDVYCTLIDELLKILQEKFVGHYKGPLGVDMMIVCDKGQFRIHPCVEINVRRTMGFLSLDLAKLVSSSVKAKFSLLYEKGAGKLLEIARTSPLPEYDGQGLLHGGVMFLTPVNEDSHFTAIIEVLPPE